VRSTSLKVNFEAGGATFDWSGDVAKFQYQSVHPVIWGWQWLHGTKSQMQVDRVPFDVGLSVLEGLQVVLGHGLGQQWRTEGMDRLNYDALTYPILDCSNAYYARRLLDLELTLSDLVATHEKAHGITASGGVKAIGRGVKTIGAGGSGFASSKKGGGGRGKARRSLKLSTFTQPAGPLRDVLQTLDLMDGIESDEQLQTARRMAVTLDTLLGLFTRPETLWGATLSEAGNGKNGPRAKRSAGKEKLEAGRRLSGVVDDERKRAARQVQLDLSNQRITMATATCIALLLVKSQDDEL